MRLQFRKAQRLQLTAHSGGLLTAEAETPLYGAIRQAALALPDVDEVEASEEGLEVNYDLLRSS